MPEVICVGCGKRFFRERRRVNEAKKFGWRVFCSVACQIKVKNSQVLLQCSRLGCKNIFKRIRKEYLKSENHFCSRSCSAIFYNSKRHKKIRICANPLCMKEFTGRRKYCSSRCIPVKETKYSREIVMYEIKQFVSTRGRIPVKREFWKIYKPARKYFGTWNKAIKAAGFSPNPVMFAKKYIAKDRHKCDSLAERIIDDWLYRRKIKHDRAVFYPGDNGLSVDFKVEDFWIEFFGLSGEIRKYDRLKRKKFRLAKQNKLNLIKIYPKHLFPRGKLDQVLGMLLN